jgi:hypothetical protein
MLAFFFLSLRDIRFVWQDCFLKEQVVNRIANSGLDFKAYF